MTTRAPARAGFRDVFALPEFRALWTSQVLSVTGDQLARVALTVLVFDRTRSALLAAVTFAASVVPAFFGGVFLGGLADRLPRRQVMVGCELISGLLVVLMLVPGLPLAVLIVLLVAVTMVGALFLAARSATVPEILDGDRYALAGAVTMTTVMSAQVAGFAVGGLVVAFLGVRVSLLADAVSFGVSALIIRIWVRARAVPAATAPAQHSAASPSQDPVPPEPARRTWPGSAAVAGARLVFASPAMRTPMLFGWLSGFYGVPEGIAAPLAAATGGGTPAVGLILAAAALGTAVGVVGFSRLVTPAQRQKWTGPLAIGACASLLLFAVRPPLAVTLLILTLSGLLSCYQIAANNAFARACPPARRSQAFGIAQGGIALGQGTSILLAGAAAEHVSTALVIATAGAAGALCALALMLTATTGRHHYPGRRRPAHQAHPAHRQSQDSRPAVQV